ncbi:MAG: hypothetical protein ACR2OI_09225, partial [Acidimicrobiia bacterium]
MAHPDRSNYSHAEMVNRRARLVVALAVFVGLMLFGATAFGSKAVDPVETSLAVIVPPTAATLPPISVLASTLSSDSTSTTAIRSTTTVRPSSTTTSPVTTTTTTTLTATTTTTRPPTTTSTAPPTTATTRVEPTTTTTRVEPTTTTTTKPKPSTTTTVITVPPTTTTTTTTLPPTTTTTTTAPTNAWYPILDATVLCQSGQPAIRWRAYDPAAAWSNGWQMVIDGDNRGVFTPGTIVTANSGPAQAIEPVPVGTHKLTVSV